MNTAMQQFDNWYNNTGHWIYNSKNDAFDTWKTNGIDGLPEFASFKLGFTPFQYLPLYAKISIERLDQDSALRTCRYLQTCLDGYAKTYGEKCDQQTRESAFHIAYMRFPNFNKED